MSSSSIPPKKSQFHWQILRNRLSNRKSSSSNPISSHTSTSPPFLSHRDITTYNLARKNLICKSLCGYYETHAYLFVESGGIGNKELDGGDHSLLGMTSIRTHSLLLSTCKIRLRHKVKIHLSDIKPPSDNKKLNGNTATATECVDNTGNTGIWLSEEIMGFLMWSGLTAGMGGLLRTADCNGPIRIMEGSDSCRGERCLRSTSSAMNIVLRKTLHENILRYFLVNDTLVGVQSLESSSSTTIMELGCGIALAGFTLYQCLHHLITTTTEKNISHSPQHQFHVILSDGNKQVCSNVQWNYDNICAPRYPALDKALSLSVAYIPWQNPEAYRDYKNSVDFIFISDCLFFKDFHEDLLDLLASCLTCDGVIWILAPPRPPTMDLFLERARARNMWQIQMLHDFDSVVNEAARRMKENEWKNLFDDKVHRPEMIVMRRQDGHRDRYSVR